MEKEIWGRMEDTIVGFGGQGKKTFMFETALAA